jgi:hypothetical protein
MKPQGFAVMVKQREEDQSRSLMIRVRWAMDTLLAWGFTPEDGWKIKQDGDRLYLSRSGAEKKPMGWLHRLLALTFTPSMQIEIDGVGAMQVQIGPSSCGALARLDSAADTYVAWEYNTGERRL